MPADALLQDIDGQARRLGALLRDPAQCVVGWVTLPERMAIEETSDGLRALTEQNITVDQVIINRMTPPPRTPCRWCDGRRSLEREAFLELERRVDRGQTRHCDGARGREGAKRYCCTARTWSAT